MPDGRVLTFSAQDLRRSRRPYSRLKGMGHRIVLRDRYPSSRSGAPDAPQLTHLPMPSRGASLRRWSAALEARFYADTPAPDLMIHLTAPLDVTLARSAARQDGAGGVRAWRHALSSELEFDGAPVRRIDTDRPLEVVVREVKTAIRDAVADDLPLEADR